MHTLLQNLANGITTITEAPTPTVSPGTLLINSTVSLISAGTERMLVDFGRASLLVKARQQPEKVAMVIDKIKTDGLLTTIDTVQSKLGQPIPLGYSNVGRVADIGKNVTGYKIGNRVVSNGGHADVVRVSKNLCAKIPDTVSDEAAAFTVVASIALQGIRLAQPTLGETVVVTGVGLIGLMAVQLLRAQGCRVLAIDFDDKKLALARELGAETCNPGKGEDPVSIGMGFSRGNGVDAVIITAATKSNDPVTQAARMSRKRGRIVLVGVVGLELNRADFYEKELTFQVSCSYGPGRYDPNYEDNGQDYPIGFVRWTEQRNFEAVLDMMASGQLQTAPLITHRFLFEKAADAYDLLTTDKSVLGVLLEYTSDVAHRHTPTIQLKTTNSTVKTSAGIPVLGIIGAGNYASRILIPAFKKAGASCHTIVTSSGTTSVIHGTKTGFQEASTDTNQIFQNPEINTVVIATQHNTHAKFVIEALKTNKHVFVEKPLALLGEDITAIEQAYREQQTPSLLMVGFNRRFAPQVQKMKALLSAVKEPKSFIMTINAGAIPATHWTQNTETGGGRIIGEACHFIDLMRYLVGHEIVSIQARRMGDNSFTQITEDKAAIILGFADGSFGTIHYYANGSSAFPKERIEVFTAGRVLQLDNFRKLIGFGWPGFKKLNLWRQDKGQTACCKAFLDAIKQGKESPIPVQEIFEVAKTSLQIAIQLRSQQ